MSGNIELTVFHSSYIMNFGAPSNTLRQETFKYKSLHHLGAPPKYSNRIIIELLLTTLPKYSIFYVTIKKQ